MLGFDEAMPSLKYFSMLLISCNCAQWKNIADCLNDSVYAFKLLEILKDDERKDKKAFLIVLARWREKAVKSGAANWKNFRKALANFDDIVKAIEKIKQG